MQPSPTYADPATDAAPNATPADEGRQEPRLASISRRGRAVAFAAATLAATLSVGSQLGLLTHYSGEAELLLARLKPASNAGAVMASAAPLAPRRSISTKFDPARGARWPWSHTQQPAYAQNDARP